MNNITMKKIVLIILVLLLACPLFAEYVSLSSLAFNFGYQKGEVDNYALDDAQLGFGALWAMFEKTDESKLDFGFGIKTDFMFSRELDTTNLGLIFGPYFNLSLNDHFSLGLLIGPGFSIIELDRVIPEDAEIDYNNFLALGPSIDVSLNYYPINKGSFSFTIGSAAYSQFFLEKVESKPSFNIIPYFACTFSYTATQTQTLYIY